MTKIDTIFLHHTAVSWRKNPDQFDATNAYHRKKWNFKSSLGFFGGYNYETSKFGVTRQFRKDGEVTAAQWQLGYNKGRALSHAMDGNFDIEYPTEEQVVSVWRWLQEKMKQYNIPKERVFHHRYIANKTCAGKLVPDDIYGYLERRIKLIEMKKKVVDDETIEEKEFAEKVPSWALDAWETITTTKAPVKLKGEPEDQVIMADQFPNEPITRAEFATIIKRLGLIK